MKRQCKYCGKRFVVGAHNQVACNPKCGLSMKLKEAAAAKRSIREMCRQVKAGLRSMSQLRRVCTTPRKFRIAMKYLAGEIYTTRR